MRMLGFRVQYYRGIIDAGWLDARDTTVVVGKNESGKTTLLKALWKFHPADDRRYDIEREWPRARRRERDDAQPVATVRFAFTEEERQALQVADPAACWLTGVEISRTYRGDYHYRFLPLETEYQPDARRVIDAITAALKQRPGDVVDEMKQGWAALMESARRRALAYNRPFVVREMAPISRPPAAGPLPLQVTSADEGDGVKPLARTVIEMVHGWLPTFLYMDDYQIFRGSAQLDQVKSRRDAGRLTDEDGTFLKILALAGLDLDAEVRKAQQPNRERRMMDLNDAAQTLTEKMAPRWTQKRYAIQFQADGQHFVTFVRDLETGVMVPLEDRSRGFQWFFSFDLNFMYETGACFRNAVLLLDEPGLHLHAAAQRDLLARFREYAQRNQLVYTTNLPFMLDYARPDTIYLAEECGQDGTRFHRDWARGDHAARLALQAALGLSLTREVLADEYTLLVEDVADYWLLDALSTLLRAAGREGLDDRLVITPAGGGSAMALIGPVLAPERRRVALLRTGQGEEEGVPPWMVEEGCVLTVGQALGADGPRSLEDVFPHAYYAEQVRAAYGLNGEWTHAGPVAPVAPVTVAAARRLAAIGASPFDRRRVARQLLQHIARTPLPDLPLDALDNAGRLVAAVNAIVRGWDAE